LMSLAVITSSPMSTSSSLDDSTINSTRDGVGGNRDARFLGGTHRGDGLMDMVDKKNRVTEGVGHFDSHVCIVVLSPESQKHAIGPIHLLFTNRIHPLKVSNECLVSASKRNSAFTGCNLQ
jgi:hypothetical protein